MTDDWIIKFCQYFTAIEFYVICILLLTTLLVLITVPIFMLYYGLSGLTIKIKNHRKKKSHDRMTKTLQDGNTDAYIMQLEDIVHKKLKKKKKHK